MNREALQPGWWERACRRLHGCIRLGSSVLPGLEWFLLWALLTERGALVHLSPPAELSQEV